MLPPPSPPPSSSGEKAEKAVALSRLTVSAAGKTDRRSGQYRIEKERRGTRADADNAGQLIDATDDERISLRHGGAVAVTTHSHSAASPYLLQPATFQPLSLLLLRSLPRSLFPQLVGLYLQAMLRTLSEL